MCRRFYEKINLFVGEESDEKRVGSGAKLGQVLLLRALASTTLCRLTLLTLLTLLLSRRRIVLRICRCLLFARLWRLCRRCLALRRWLGGLWLPIVVSVILD